MWYRINGSTDIYMAAYGNSKGKKDTPSEFEAPNV